MTHLSHRLPLGTMLLLVIALAITGNFAFAAMQGDHGLLRRTQIQADIEVLAARKAELQAELARLANLTGGLSDTALDLDLLDERARLVLGYLRADEVVIH